MSSISPHAEDRQVAERLAWFWRWLPGDGSAATARKSGGKWLAVGMDTGAIPWNQWTPAAG